ncbi:hypothetical protein MGYG_09108 [Nannizzia gypsea CBS 118893]|uniref:Uncharacterized protein n=1 Tax=Arthroderma gypseum (strain ATCC MYA-4604 / CBS 118893) TaxID=535722 RepID=E4V099_ARTGP|nr:hypothetical protein MGYG_09108 [Nannizzia gypsea CBS 118893]EFR03036.1 hypothetical protein MGYG_09108 [Nannizzia gypsea CBS 118893]
MTCIIGYRRTGADPAAADENETQASASENQLDGARLGNKPLVCAKGPISPPGVTPLNTAFSVAEVYYGVRVAGPTIDVIYWRTRPVPLARCLVGHTDNSVLSFLTSGHLCFCFLFFFLPLPFSAHRILPLSLKHDEGLSKYRRSRVVDMDESCGALSSNNSGADMFLLS